MIAAVAEGENRISQTGRYLSRDLVVADLGGQRLEGLDYAVLAPGQDPHAWGVAV